MGWTLTNARKDAASQRRDSCKTGERISGYSRVVSDDRLRELERRARAAPDDAMLGWTYARALEQAGKLRASYLELVRLERAGFTDARVRLRELEGWSARTQAAHEAPVGAVTIARRSRLEVACEWIAATDRFLLGQSGRHGRNRTLTAFDLDTLEVLWTAPTSRTSVHVWQGLALLSLEGSQLLLRDGRTGRQEARRSLGAEYVQLHASGDRAFLAGPDTSRRLYGVELGARFGEHAWSERQLPLQDLGFGGDMAVLLFPGAGHQGRRIEDGDLAWRSEERGAVKAIDSEGVVLHVSADADDRQLVEHALDTGRVKWRMPHFYAGSLRVVLAPEVALGMLFDHFYRPPDSGVLAVSRSTGRRLWERPALQDAVAWARAGGNVYVITAREGSGHFELLALDLATGKTLFTMSEPFDHGKGHTWTAIPAKRDLLVLVSHAKEGVTHVWRFGGN